MIRQYELVEKIHDYNPGADEDLINRAYVFAMKAHGTQKRASGDPYFTHPLEVASILADMHLDTDSIATGLLHDTVEDTLATLDDISAHFGTDIAQLVDGVTKLSRLEWQSDESKQAENFRKLVLAMSKDLRVLLVKLADRLHNMRTLDAISRPEKRHGISRETLEIYVPLAERIGAHQLKNELEDFAFAHLQPEARESVLSRLAYLRQDGGAREKDIVNELQALFVDAPFQAEISGREKKPYSIWRKMQKKSIDFEQLADIMAFRVVVPEIDDCYRALGMIHARYQSLPSRFKDYISTPKPNGYRSLHTAVIGPSQHRIEIQIRTTEMHESADLGVAAHWAYKEGRPGTDGEQYRWLRSLLEIFENSHQPEEALADTRMELFDDQVFCFTPKGRLINLPQGATAIDFAYAIHSEVGNACVGAKVNGNLLPLRHILSNGDQVEILTSKTQRPSPEWDRIVVTGKARAAIRRFIRLEKRAEYLRLGRAILQKEFRQAGYDYVEKSLDGVLKKFRRDSVDDLLAAVGEGLVSGREVFNGVFPGHGATAAKSAAEEVVAIQARSRPAKNSTHAIPIKGLIPGMAVHYARCCHPIPGDRIVGIVTTGKGVTIHTIDCETLESFYEQPERWLDVSWEGGAAEEDHVGRIFAVIANVPGSLGSISTVIGKNKGNITNLKVMNRTEDFFEMAIDIHVSDVRHLSNIIAALRATPQISHVDRASVR